MDVATDAPWLVLIHQLPPKPSYLRVKVWRRLQALGAVPIKNSVYVLPRREDTREDFEWMLREIQREGGEASLCEARLVDGLTDDEVRGSFVSAREKDYRELATDVRSCARETLPRRGRPLGVEARAQLASALARFQKRLAEIGEIDFFGAPGRETVDGLLGDMESRLVENRPGARPTGTARRELAGVPGRTWITRSGVHIDRMACAWLIRRFIDPKARFAFVASDRGYEPPPRSLRFDMFDAEFTHDGELCTFEVLLREFDLRDAALGPIAEIVHDIDLKEARFSRPETPGVEHLILGIAWNHSADEARIESAAAVFDAFYTYFKRRK